jgi:hypothetical protein
LLLPVARGVNGATCEPAFCFCPSWRIDAIGDHHSYRFDQEKRRYCGLDKNAAQPHRSFAPADLVIAKEAPPAPSST